MDSGIIFRKASRADSGGNGAIPPNLRTNRNPSETIPAMPPLSRAPTNPPELLFLDDDELKILNHISPVKTAPVLVLISKKSAS